MRLGIYLGGAVKRGNMVLITDVSLPLKTIKCFSAAFFPYILLCVVSMDAKVLPIYVLDSKIFTLHGGNFVFKFLQSNFLGH